jgi:hypothetical protein
MSMSEQVITTTSTGSRGIRELKNGALYNLDTHRIVQAPPLERRPIRDSATARAIANTRIETLRSATADALTEHALANGIVNATDYDGLKRVNANLISIATGRQGKEAVMAAEAIAKFGGYLASPRDNPDSDALPVSIDVQQANIVLQLIVQSVVQADLGSNPTYQNVNSRKSDADDASSTIIDGQAHDDDSAGSV